MLTYNPTMFDAPDQATARRIILTPDGRSTADRWRTETPGLTALAGATLGLRAESVVLDYGCGIGRMAKAMIERFGCRVVGTDISPNMRGLAKDYVNSALFTCVSREELLELEISFDAAVAIWVLQHCHHPDVDCEIINRKLSGQGRLLVVNNFHRAVPVVEQTWANDGFDVVDHLAKAFREIERGELPAEMLGQVLASQTFWGVYACR